MIPTAVLFFSQLSMTFHYARQAVHVRAMEYLLKPYTERELLDVLDEAVRLTRRRLENTSPAPSPVRISRIRPSSRRAKNGRG